MTTVVAGGAQLIYESLIGTVGIYETKFTRRMASSLQYA